jgi:hypothetical protein
MTDPEKPHSEKPAARAAREAPHKLSAAERKRYLETMKREAARHSGTLAALAK